MGKKYLINGSFLKEEITGVDRYAIEITKELDKICEGLDITILVKKDAVNIPLYENIKIKKSILTYPWTQFVFGLEARLMGATPINLCNEIAVIAPPGFVCLHDVVYAENNDYFPDPKERKWNVDNYQRICNRSKKIITVSEYSKSRIETLFGVDESRIAVIGNAWQHYTGNINDEGIFDKFSSLKKGEYYFTLASLNKNKNLEWVLDAATHNPDSTFVLAGKMLSEHLDLAKHPNVVYIGYVHDNDAKVLMKYCKGFIFPSLYEGFGIPPMEAMYMGAPVIVSDVTSLPEIYGKSVHYINPHDANVNLDELIKEPVEPAKEVLDRFSWEKSAKKFLKLLEEDAAEGNA